MFNWSLFHTKFAYFFLFIHIIAVAIAKYLKMEISKKKNGLYPNSYITVTKSRSSNFTTLGPIRASLTISGPAALPSWGHGPGGFKALFSVSS